MQKTEVMPKITTESSEFLIRYGSAASEAMFDFPCHFFRIPNGIGVIAYRIEYKCAIIFGDPLCPPSELIELTQAFHKHCQDSNLDIIYIAVSEKFARLANEYCPILMEVCEELIMDPQINPISKSHRLKHRVEKATKYGLTFHEYIPFDKKIENSLLEVGMKWQKARKGPNLYLGHLNFFENSLGKRWFYVKHQDQITSMAMLSRLDAQEGWLLKFFFTMPNAFHETSEFLMVSLLKKLKEENCHFLTKGMVPVDSINETKGLGWCTKPIKYIYKMINSIFQFKKHKEYWQRYHPKKAPAFLLFSNSRIKLNQIRALLKSIKL